MPRTDRDIILFADGAIVDYSRTVDQGRVLKFRIQLRAEMLGTMRNILRYDNAHGVVHRHRCWLPGEPALDLGPFATLDEAWQWCLEDLLASTEQSVEAAERYFTKEVN